MIIDGSTLDLYLPMPKANAREYRYHPELLVPEVILRASPLGKRFEKVIFHGPGKNELYTGDLGCFSLVDGIVIDPKTGLEWKAGPDKDTTWNGAKSWVQSLNLDGGGWRMPTLDELESLYKKATGNRNMTPLLETTGWLVWSGASIDSSRAWDFGFYDGQGYCHVPSDRHNSRAFAVRSESGE